MIEDAERSTAASKHVSRPVVGGGVRTPPLRPGGCDPADYAVRVVRSAGKANVSPPLVMTVLARGVPPGRVARSCLRRFRAYRSRAAAVLADGGRPRDAVAG